MIYLPLPDKVNIYRHRLPTRLRGNSEREQFLVALRAGMAQRKILNLDLYREFRERAHESETLYFKDDTHWNAKGVETAVAATARLIRDDKLLR